MLYITFIDFKKAFDSVPHNHIINALKESQVDDNTLNLTQLLLSQYKTSIDGKNIIRIKKGVP